MTLRRSAEERELLRQGLTLRTEEQMDRALYDESPDSQYADRYDHENNIRGFTGTMSGWGGGSMQRVSDPGRSGVPTIDDDPDGDPHVFPRSYPAWRDGETFVVSGPVGDYGNDFADLGRGRPFHTRAQARAWAKAKYGAVIEETLLKSRYCLRVPVPGGPHDPRVKR